MLLQEQNFQPHVLVLDGYSPNWAHRFSECTDKASFVHLQEHSKQIVHRKAGSKKLESVTFCYPSAPLPGSLRHSPLNVINRYRLGRVISQLEVHSGRFDLIHAHWYSSMVDLHESALPVVLTEHSNVFGRHLRQPTPQSRRSITVARRSVEEASIICPVSKHLFGLMRQCGIDHEFVRVIPNPVDTGIFSPRRIGERDDESWKILTVGRLATTKNHSGLLDAVSVLSASHRISLRIAGDGPERGKLTEQATQLGIDDRVEFLGSISQTEVAQEMRDADLYVQSSIVESFGVPVIEALLSGLPVVATPVGVASDIGDNEPLLTVGAGFSSMDLVTAIELAMNSARDRRANANVEHLVERFGCKEVGKQVRSVYEEVLEQARMKS